MRSCLTGTTLPRSPPTTLTWRRTSRSTSRPARRSILVLPRSDRLSLPFLPRNADVQDGDLLVTSGLGGTFPPGYPVGIVSDVQSEAGEPFLAISAEPSAALNRIREVLLIYPGTGTPAAMPAKPDSDLQTEPDRISGEESPSDENISNPAPEENSPEEETSDEEETSAGSSGSSGDET